MYFTQPALAARGNLRTVTGVMFHDLPPLPNYLLRIALAFGAGLMMAALL